MSRPLVRKSMLHGANSRRWGMVVGLSLVGCVAAVFYLTMPPGRAQPRVARAQINSASQGNATGVSSDHR